MEFTIEYNGEQVKIVVCRTERLDNGTKYWLLVKNSMITIQKVNNICTAVGQHNPLQQNFLYLICPHLR